MKRGRPKGQSKDKRSFGPLGDLIRAYRMQKNYGLLEVAKACKCSVQFVSNIEHGRAPLPWEKAEKLAKFLGISLEELQAANLAIRSDFKSFLKTSSGKSGKSSKGASQLGQVKDAASLLTLTAQDSQLRDLLQKYQEASVSDRKKFYAQARKLLGGTSAPVVQSAQQTLTQ